MAFTCSLDKPYCFSGCFFQALHEVVHSTLDSAMYFFVLHLCGYSFSQFLLEIIIPRQLGYIKPTDRLRFLDHMVNVPFRSIIATTIL